MGATLEQALVVLREHWGHDEFRQDQETVIEHVLTGKDVLAVLPTGYGKCFAAGTPILMFDGTVRPVESVVVGDLVMGPDSRPRTVLSLAHGYEQMYRVVPKKGDGYIVNASHVLSLKRTPQGGPYPSQQGGVIRNISVRDWLSASQTFRHVHKGWRAAVDFAELPLHPDLPPYILGLWLGDGNSRGARFTWGDEELSEAVREYAAKHPGMVLTKGSAKYAWELSDTEHVHGRGHHPNVFLNALRDLNLLENKHIPHAYKTASKEDRLLLLAGLIDTDGNSVRGLGYEIVQKLKPLALGIAFVARSLGFAVSVMPKLVDGAAYYRLTIYGDVERVPVRLERKRCGPRKQKKDVLRTGIQVIPVGKGEYYGFAVDGDHLFLLDDFTVVHNSAAFQIPAILKPGCALVISPLIALMKDQCDDCQSRGIPATYVNSHVPSKEQEERLADFVAGAYKLFYVAPERIKSKPFISAVQRADISYLIVDECHCVSVWGHAFRPMYMRIKDILEFIKGERPPIIAVTATATADIEDDIALGLGMEDEYTRIVGDPIRANLSYTVECGNPWTNLGDWVDRFNVREGRYIIYVGTRNGAKSVRESVVAPIIAPALAGVYHAGMSKSFREEIQEGFKSGEIPVIVATCAFGMGIDVPNIRAVIHFGIPGSLEAYVQESGRCGRDGKPGDAVLLDSDYSYTLQRMFVDNANPPYEVFEALWLWLHGVLQNGEVLALSGERIAQQIEMEFGRELGMDASAGLVLGVLNTMEAHGLVTRAYMSGGVATTINLERMREIAAEDKHFSGKAAKAILTNFVDPNLPESPPSEYNLSFTRPALAEATGLTDPAVARTLKTLQKKGAFTFFQTFNGKSTKIRKYNAPLEDHLSREFVEKKRARELKRLRKMIEYVSCENRVQFIRDYFARGLGIGPQD